MQSRGESQREREREKKETNTKRTSTKKIVYICIYVHSKQRELGPGQSAALFSLRDDVLTRCIPARRHAGRECERLTNLFAAQTLPISSAVQ